MHSRVSSYFNSPISVSRELAHATQFESGFTSGGPWTLLSNQGYPLHMTLSARNRIEGKVVETQVGGVMAHVVVRAGEIVIESVITKRSLDEMKLKVGDKVSAVIKSTEVMLEKD